MRKEFSGWLETIAQSRKDLMLLTGDLGFMALEGVAQVLEKRFVNVGVSEQNMMSMAAALAHEGMTPLCYSIAPFAVFRPAEQIRLDICLHNKNVKIVGNGGGYGYGIMGATHHAIEDLAMLSSFQNMVCYVPFHNGDVASVCDAMLARKGPAYLRLGFGVPPVGIISTPYSSIRKIASGHTWTVVGIGPVILNALRAAHELRGGADVFVVSELPCPELSQDLIESLQRTGKVLIVEEHVERGGLAEWLCLMLMKAGLHPQVWHQCAKGYPDNLYGSQAFHQKQCGLDEKHLLGLMSQSYD